MGKSPVMKAIHSFLHSKRKTRVQRYNYRNTDIKVSTNIKVNKDPQSQLVESTPFVQLRTKCFESRKS